jgi:hypothetical protein
MSGPSVTSTTTYSLLLKVLKEQNQSSEKMDLKKQGAQINFYPTSCYNKKKTRGFLDSPCFDVKDFVKNIPGAYAHF